MAEETEVTAAYIGIGDELLAGRTQDTNFFYLASPTEAQTILSFFGTGIMYYLNLEVAALIVFSISYIPMWQLIKAENRKRLKAFYQQK